MSDLFQGLDTAISIIDYNQEALDCAKVVIELLKTRQVHFANYDIGEMELYWGFKGNSDTWYFDVSNLTTNMPDYKNLLVYSNQEHYNAFSYSINISDLSTVHSQFDIAYNAYIMHTVLK